MATNDPHLARRSTEFRRSRQAEMPITVILADDHQAVRRSLRLLLHGEPDVEVVGEAASLFTAMRHVNRYLPQALVLDLRMPDGSSLEVVRRLHARAPETAIVVVTMEDSPALARQALALGALGYVLKDHADSELPAAIRHAARGEQYLSPHMAARPKAERAISIR